MPQRGLRSQRIAIDLPTPKGYKWIDIRIQSFEVTPEGAMGSLVDDAERLNRRLDKVALETITVIDPVTQQEVTISVAGLAEAIKWTAYRWLEEEYGVEYDPVTDRMVYPEQT